jgi:hypothetical protein
MSAPPALEASFVQQLVGAAHGDLDCVKEMLGAHPQLANACWDWGGGDFETGLGAAAHMGRRDIAELLLTHGARMDIFAAAMLGNLEVVKAIIEAQPEAATALGPHGIPLMQHAIKGGEGSEAVVKYLSAL